MKPRLLILSDLFGGDNPEWINFYIERLNADFDIQYYDVLKLSEFACSDDSEITIHNHFLNGGIDTAIQNLVQLEKQEVTILGFSIGGTIAWKAALNGLKVSNLIAVSSTRLRFETNIPKGEIKLYFGELDENKPNSKWFSDFKIDPEIHPNQNHQLYKKEQNAVLICKDVLESHSQQSI